MGWHCTTFRTTVLKKTDYGDVGFIRVGQIPERSGDDSIRAECHVSWDQLATMSERLTGTSS